MPRIDWGINAQVIDNYDRSSGFTPYRGPIPPNGVYDWLIKKIQYVAGTRNKYPQLRLGLELAPREGEEEEAYAGYFIMVFRSVAEQTDFAYVPILDALGVSARDFTSRTIADAEGNISRIGQWKNDGKQYIAGQLKDGADQHGTPRKEIGWIGPVDDYGDDEDDYEGEEIEDDEEVPF